MKAQLIVVQNFIFLQVIYKMLIHQLSNNLSRNCQQQILHGIGVQELLKDTPLSEVLGLLSEAVILTDVRITRRLVQSVASLSAFM